MPSPGYGTNSTVFKHYKILVNREKKTCGERYYESRIKHLKDEHPKRWWDEMRRQWSKLKTKNDDLCSQIKADYFSGLPKWSRLTSSIEPSSNR